MQIDPLGRADLERLAAAAARWQADPHTASAYLGDTPEVVASELAETEGAFVGAGTPDLSAWILGEVDEDIGRVWWMGPYGVDDDLQDVVYEHAVSRLPETINEQELAADRRNLEAARFARRHGFAADPASYGLNLAVPTAAPDTSPSVRRTSAADHEAVVLLHDQTFPQGHYRGRDLFARHEVWVSVGPSEDVVGYVAVEPQPDGSSYIDFLAVAPEARREGHARALVTAVIGHAADSGRDRVHLTVRETLSGARALYEDLGFVVDSVLVPYRKGFTLGAGD